MMHSTHASHSTHFPVIKTTRQSFETLSMNRKVQLEEQLKFTTVKEKSNSITQEEPDFSIFQENV